MNQIDPMHSGNTGGFGTQTGRTKMNRNKARRYCQLHFGRIKISFRAYEHQAVRAWREHLTNAFSEALTAMRDHATIFSSILYQAGQGNRLPEFRQPTASTLFHGRHQHALHSLPLNMPLLAALGYQGSYGRDPKLCGFLQKPFQSRRVF